MKIETENYKKQEKIWPKTGRHILARFTDASIVVYQAYKPSIGLYAKEKQWFGGEFSFSRMSWIKPNFLWMMYRSGWGTKPDQEVTLAVTIKLPFFEKLLAQAVVSSYRPNSSDSHSEWKKRITNSNVRLQWDPDHDPYGHKLERKAIQLGLRNEVLKEYSENGILEIEDISPFVKQQRHYLQDDISLLEIPLERVYTPISKQAVSNIDGGFNEC